MHGSRSFGHARGGALALALAAAALAGCMPAPPTGRAASYQWIARAPLRVEVPPGAPAITQEPRPASREMGEGHEGIDIAAAEGHPVLAPAPGRVVAAPTDGLYGRQLVIDHGPDGAGGRWFTRYFHLSARSVRPGQRVARGERIGAMGRTGALAGGFVHLHFELRRGRDPAHSDWVDPNRHWAGGPGRVVCWRPGLALPDRGPDGAPLLTYPVACGGGAE